MGKIKKGVFGGFSGRIGNIIGASWNGIAYMRSEAQSIKNPRTEPQLKVRDNFAAIAQIVGQARPLFITSDWRTTKGGSYFSKAMQMNYDRAVTENGIDKTKLVFGQFSRGGIVGLSASLTLVENKPTLHIEGTRVVDNKSGFADDILVVVICKSEPEGEGDGTEGDVVTHTFIELDDGTTIDLDADLQDFIDHWDDQDYYIYVGVAPNNLKPTYGISYGSNMVSFACSHLKV